MSFPESNSRPQFHYFYGSTESDESPKSPQLSDNDILLGESLVPTDTEEDGTHDTRSQNFLQVLLTNGRELHNGSNTLRQSSTESYQYSDPPNRPPSSQNEENESFIFYLESMLNTGGSRSYAHITRVCVFILMMSLIVTLFFLVLKSRAPPTTKSPTISRKGFQTPYPVVDRADYNDPASNIVNSTLFAPALLFNEGRKEKTDKTTNIIYPFLRVPFPTGAFWTNLVTEPPGPKGLSHPIVAYPYAFKWSEFSLQASYPVIRRKEESRSIYDIFQPDISFETAEGISNRHIMKFDVLSVTTRFYTTDQGFWESYIVHGSPYITIKYSSTTPILKAFSIFQKVMCPFDQDGNYYDGNENLLRDGLSPPAPRKLTWRVCTPSTGSGDDDTAVLHGVQFLLQTQEDMTWILFASELIELKFDATKRTEIVASKKFTGVLRLALIPPTSDYAANGETLGLLPLSASTGLKRLVYHSGVYPVGGSVTWDFRSTISPTAVAQNAVNIIAGKTPVTSSNTGSDGKKVGIVHFNFETRFLNQNLNSNLQLLTLVLPHHANVLQPELMLGGDDFDLEYNCIKGTMTPVVGSTWSYEEKLTNTVFDRVAKYGNKTMDPNVAELILKNIKIDIDLLQSRQSPNIHIYGKEVARLAQLAHIAKVVTKQSKASSLILEIATSKLYDSLVSFLRGQANDELVYDAKFGGIVSRNNLLDLNDDIGNGRYSNHHFHYGYVLYASAVLGQLNSTFVHEHGECIDSLLNDIAHKGNVDSETVDEVFFPFARHTSWYDGHSFAVGLFPQPNGKSQESSSEAVNGYYGGYLWSTMKKNMGLSAQSTDFLRLLLTMEIRGAQTYWHMFPSSLSKNVTISRAAARDTDLVYKNSTFRSNYMVGYLGMLDAVCSTYFAKELYFAHLINLLPITAITSELFSKEYVRGQYEHVIAKANIPKAWRGYSICNHAIINPTNAWEEAQNLISSELDEGISKSQVLYFISTLEDFDVSNLTIIGNVGADKE
eukprot:CAMPEP_0194137240 /NCGR_PEP_ID=MMETSP0152-20130528/7162_1 /TAXON_ID=1049557 /ORGANISM="Thalassiothrix antarctica, Strain L6-D1" /LENGTH=1002 /DNA_ID=CAMNT_0038834195 /DNA_START=329 /DNA_END=3337 /DNA_ORIENTATION=+